MQSMTRDLLSYLDFFVYTDKDLISLLSTTKEFHKYKSAFTYNQKDYTFDESVFDLWYNHRIQWVCHKNPVELVHPLPQFVTKLKFGPEKIKKLISGDIPDHVSDVTLDNNSCTSLRPGILPKSLKKLTLNFFGRPILNRAIPFGTKEIVFFYPTCKMDPFAFPKSVTSVTLYTDSSNPSYEFKLSMLPLSLRKLVLMGPRPIFDSIPKCITHLYIYNNLWEPYTIPESVTHLFIGPGILSTISSYRIPPTVKHLVLDRFYRVYNKKGEIPDTLESIRLHRSVAFSLPPIPKITYY
jgi:hypothetical protein